MSDARRRAEQALAHYETCPGGGRWRECSSALAVALRALLAAEPEAGAGGLDALAIEINEWAAVTFPVRTAASVAEHLRREAHELAEAPLDPEEMADVFILLANLWKFTGVDLPCAVAAKLAKNRARKWGKPDAQGVVEHVREGPQALAAEAATPPPPDDAVAATGEMGPARGYLAVCARSVDNVRTGWPPSDAVREAAERLWYRLTPPANVTENGCVFVPAEDLETVLRALRANASPAPGSEGVREAEAVLAEAREALDEIRRRSTDKLAGGIAASFLGAHPRAALAARGGE